MQTHFPESWMYFVRTGFGTEAAEDRNQIPRMTHLAWPRGMTGLRGWRIDMYLGNKNLLILH